MKVAKLVSLGVSPKFAHDCGKCHFLGRLDGKDLYVCNENGQERSLVVRRGNREEEYGAMSYSIVAGHEEAFQGTEYRFALKLLQRNPTLRPEYRAS